MNPPKSSKSNLKKRIGNHNIVQLPTNYIPCDLIPLEKKFDHNYIPCHPDKKKKNFVVHEHNIDISFNPKLVNLPSNLTVEQKFDYCHLMKDFSDVFA